MRRAAINLSGDTDYAIDTRILGGPRYTPGYPGLVRWTPKILESYGRALTGYRADNGEMVIVASRKVICTWAEHERAIAATETARQQQRAEHEALAAAQEAERSLDRLRRSALEEMFGEDAWRLPHFAQVPRVTNRDSNNGNVTLENLTFLLKLAYLKGQHAR